MRPSSLRRQRSFLMRTKASSPLPQRVGRPLMGRSKLPFGDERAGIPARVPPIDQRAQRSQQMPASHPVPAPAPTVTLPAVIDVTGPMLTALTAALGVERAIIATDEQIGHVWSNLPRLLSRIPAEHRSETLARMCVAVAAGLLDSAINYAWNAAIVELRAKVRRFGLTVVPQVIKQTLRRGRLGRFAGRRSPAALP